jgi:ABC-2 type transport system ATP-binding protein
LVVLGTPDELKAALGGAEVTMDDVFTHFTGGSIEARGDYRDTSRTRLSVHRLG